MRKRVRGEGRGEEKSNTTQHEVEFEHVMNLRGTRVEKRLRNFLARMDVPVRPELPTPTVTL